MHRRHCVTFLMLLAFAVPGANAVAQEHPDIPPPGAFDSTLHRDLNLYFRKGESGPIELAYRLLRDGPTVSGIAYPKFYVWVEVRKAGDLVRVGAARVAAIDRSFQVTNFLPAAYIVAHPDSVGAVFPAPLVDEILRRARGAPSTPRRGA